MRKHRLVVLLTLLVLLTLQTATFRSAVALQQPRPIELEDIMAWKGINATSLSENGEWFGYRLAPVEGESEIVLRQTKGEKEYKFKIGEAPAPALSSGPPNPAELQPTGAAVAFSSDAKFAAFTIYPTAAEAAQARRQRQQPQNKAGIVNLETGEKIDIPKVRRYVFSGETAGWLALHKYGANTPPPDPAAATGQRGGPGGPGAPARDDRPRGADLLLRELETGQEIVIGNVGDFAFDKKGRYLAWTIDAQDKTGNGVTFRTMDTGVIRSVESDSTAVYSRLAWNEEGEGLAVLKGVDHKEYEDKLYSVVAFKDFGASGPQKTVFNPADFSDFPSGMTVSSTRTPNWTKDLSAVLFGIHKAKKKDTAERTDDNAADDRVNLVIWHWQDKRLPTQQAVQENQDRNFSYLASYRPAEKKFIR
ncbi:MAG: S9 family peptidase, partial [Acidobacteria bacterium]|nr:S9 family peptidase [Acidobacteriota bacterium]